MYNNGRGEGYDYDPPPQQPTHNSRVKVEDALTYLDQVKTQFASEPQVYTQFLDIMKDFKSQAIDTPGVITRVSNLFAGKPHLITGFNQFLPAGFEVAIDAGKIIISEPNGLRKLIENGEVFPLPPYQDYQGMGAQPEEEDEEEDEAEDEEVEREEEEQEDEDEEMEDEEQIQEDVRVAELQRLAEREDRHRSVYQFDAEDVDPEDALYAKNTSVKFVNRIKARFHSRQHVYHKFLEILGNFQEATSSEIIDVQAEQMVLDAVAQLFGDEVDLFEEFRLFMPSMASRMNRPALVEETEPKEEEKSEPEPELMNTEVEEEASEAEDEDLEDEDEEEEETEELVGDEALLGEPEESVDDEEDEDKESSDENELEEMEESEELKLPEDEQESGQEEPIRDDEESEGETSAVPEPAPSVSLPETELPVDKEYFYVSPSEDEVDEEEEEDETAGGEDEPEKPEEHDLTLPVEAEDEAEDEEEGDEETELDEEEIATLEKMEAEGFLQDEEEEEDIAFGELEDITSESGSDNDESDFETGELELISKKYPEHDIMGRMDELFRSMSVEDITLIEKIRRTATAAQYNVFLRAMATFNARIISGQELLALLYPVIGGCGSLLNEFNRQFIALDHSTAPAAMDCLTEEQKHNIDYASCKQLGVSYRSLPDTMEPPKCSGRTLLCHSVLNDTWVSFPSWSSEDTTVVSAKKTPYEEFVCKTEDERFELDIIIENNKYAIDALECQRRKMNRLSTHEQKQFKLDESLGGSSQTLMVKALKRIYGENATKIIDSLRNNPSLSIPKIIDRMKDKERDWIEAQEQMNKVWKEQNDRHMAKALDHLSNAMKTSDAKWIKAKQLVHQMEVLFDERQTKFVEGRSDDEGPHMMLYYPEDKTVMKDANELIIHHISKQSSISSSEKERITVVLKRLVKELFFIPYHLEDNSDDADDEDEIQEGLENMDDVKMGCSTRYRMIYGGNPLLVFMRVYHILCERLFRIKESWREMCATYEMDERLQEERKRIYTEQGSHKSLATEMNIFDMNNGLPELRSSGQKKSVPSMYEDFLMECKNFLDGGMDALIFEDQIRNLFPLEAYMAFSIDKIVNLISRQIHLLALSNDNAECLKMYERFKVNPPFSLMDNSDRRAGIEQEYANEAETKLNCQNCFKLVTMDLQKVTVTVELVDTETEDMSMDGREIIDRALSEVGSSEEEEEEEEEDKEETMEVEKKEEVEEEEEEMPEQEPEVEEAVEEAGTSMDEKEQTPEPERRVPVFLTRNARKRQQTGLTEIHKEFQQFYGTFSVTTERTRMVSNTREGFLKITRPFGKEKKHMLDEVCKRRKLRVEGAITMSNLAGATTWLDTNSSRTVMTNPTYPFLQFNQYHLEDYAL